MPRICVKRLVIICCFLWTAYLFASCDSKDHQVAILEKETPGIEQFTENYEDADPVERYEKFREFMQLRLEKIHNLTSQFKLNIVELSGEEREEYEAEIHSIENQITSLRNELAEYDPAADSYWDSFVENIDQKAESLEEDLRHLNLNNSFRDPG